MTEKKTVAELLKERSGIDTELYTHRKNIAVLFVDVWGYTKFVDTRTDLNGRAMLQAFFDIIEPLAEKYAGVLIKKIGGEGMLIFLSPLFAVRSATAMQQGIAEYNRHVSAGDQIHAKIGIDYGEVLVEEDDAYGDVVNVAARLTGLAGRDQILFTAPVFDAIKGSEGIVCSNYGNVILEGKTNAISVHELTWRDDRSLPRLDTRQGETPLVPAIIEDGQFNSITRALDEIRELQRIQGENMAEFKPRLEAVEELKFVVRENTESLSRIKGIYFGVNSTISFLLGAVTLLLGWMGLKKWGG